MNSRPSKHYIGGSAGPSSGWSQRTSIDTRKVAMVSLLVVLALVAATAGWIYTQMQALPDPSALTSAIGRAVVVYDRTGQVLGERDPEGRYHVNLKLSEMGRYGQ